MNAPTRLRSAESPFSRMSPRRGTLGVIVRTYKAAVTREARRIGFERFGWQRNYYEHIIRSAAELEQTRDYIANNPLMWDQDEYNPEAQRVEPARV